MIAKLHKVRWAIAKSDLQRLIDKLNVERHASGSDLIPSVDELRAEETQNNTAVFEFVKSHLIVMFETGVDSTAFSEVNEAIDNSTKAIIKFFEERS